MKRLSGIFLLIVACASGLSAQTSYNFYQLSIEKGLSDTRVNAIVQDKYGFMWFGTANGLNRFDGYSVTTYLKDQRLGLPSNNILALFSSRKGELWIGTSAGLARFDFARARFIQADTSIPGTAALAKAGVYGFEEDEYGNIYAASAAGLYRFLSREAVWQNLGQQLNLSGRMRGLRKLKFFNKDLLYVTNNSSLPFYEINISTGRVDSIPFKTDFADTCCLNMFGLEKLNEEEMLVGFLSYGFARLNVKQRKYTVVPGLLSRNDSIRFNSVYDILKDDNGRVWLSTFYYNLVEYLPAANKVIPIPDDPYNPFGFEGSSVMCVYEDRQHNLWMGTGGKGVYHFNPSRNAVNFHAQHEFEAGGLQRGPVLCLLPVDSLCLLVGTEKGPSFYDPKSGTYTNFRGVAFNSRNCPVEIAQCGLADQDGIVWIGSSRLGLMRYDRKKKVFQCYSRVSAPYPLMDDGISDLLLLPGGKIFLVGYGRPGIFDPLTTRYSSFRNNRSALFKLSGISSVCYDEKRHIWLAGNGGKLYEYDPVRDVLEDHSDWISGIDSKPDIYKIGWHRHELYLGTNLGILRVKGKQEYQVVPLAPARNGITEIRGLLPDGDHIWFCNNRVLGKFYPVTGEVVILGEKEGLVNVRLFSQSLALSATGTLLVGTNRGFFEINDKLLRNGDSTTAPYLTGFRVFNKELETGSMISEVKKISLGYSENFFDFDISAFNYEEPEDIEYAYLLEGFDKGWHYLGKKRSGAYTNVPGGDYVLRLKARNASGEWNEKGQQVRIHVGKPVLATTWFRVLLLSIVAGLAYYFYKTRIRRINKEARMRSDYEIKLNELENSALRSQMNPHFIFNSLNTINSFINSNDRAQANQYISKFSKLVRLILDHSRQKKIALKDELEVSELYMQLEQIRFENRFRFSIDVNGLDPGNIEMPPLIIQPFVENAILHGLLPAEKEGVLKLEISRQENVLKCIIEDNGIGREAAKKLKGKSGNFHRSHGMEITLKRIELFNKENEVDYPVAIFDLDEKINGSTGTRVEIRLAYVEVF